MHVKPNPARVAETLALEGRAFVVRDPQLLDLLPDTGRLVPDDHHWTRLVDQGDVVVMTDAEIATYTTAVAGPVPAPSAPATAQAAAAAPAKQADRS